MELTVDAGVVIDLATKEDVAQHHKFLEDLLNRRRAGYRTLMAAVPVGSGPLVMDLGSPPAGKLYAVQWASVFPDVGSIGAAIASVVGILCVGYPSKVPPPGDIANPGFSIPSGQLNVPDVTVVHGGQRLYIVLQGTGLAAGTTVGYNANAGVLIGDDDPKTIAWI